MLRYLNVLVFGTSIQDLFPQMTNPRRRPFFLETRRIERGVLNVPQRQAKSLREKTASSLRVAPQNGPSGSGAYASHTPLCHRTSLLYLIYDL